MSKTIETKRTKDRLLISIPTDEISTEEIEDFISTIKMEFTVRKSRMTEKEAEEISAEVKDDWWKKNGPRIKEMIAENE